MTRTSGTGPLGRPVAGIRLAGTGLSLPRKVLTNADLAKMVDTSDEWITQRTGIKTRYVLDGGQTIRHLCRDALSQALAAANMKPADLDFLLVATLTPEMVCPATAVRVVAEIGATPAGGIDVNAACSGFVYSLNLATGLIRTGQCRTVGVIGADALSTVTDWQDRRTCVLFGDGAGAAVLTACDDPSRGPVYSSMASDGSMWKELYCPRSAADVPPGDKTFSGHYNTLQMNGREIFKFAVTTLGRTLDEALAAARVTPQDIAMVIPHQMNLRIIEAARARLGLPPERMYVNIDRVGNTSAASIPICLHELMSAGRLKPGDLVMLIALGGGLTWASCLWRL